ncbi:phage tail tube protein [Pseudothauera rhizosphaerae]|uniref:Uncharacterized protein n=1 Tax=Pseudothauera rhizosphaerae TaxID=2565932 RepID=A0A4S4AR38_9RHOO|nr:hypothetical protein [Pseudothauera rhizosphaerae]THF60906.1 hypothetical protein E6O51_11795 [Pseudothauera rhizosphaerae]
MTPNTPIIWTGQGPVQIGTFDLSRGVADSAYLVDVYRVGCGNSALTTSVAVEKRTIQETCSGQRATLDEFPTGKTMNVSLSMVQFSGRTLAAALFGAAVTKAAGTVTGEVLPELAVGDYVNLRYPKASSIVITDSKEGSPSTYVEGTHYEIEDAAHARLKLLAHPVDHEEPLEVDYTYGENVNIRAFSQSTVERGIIFNGINHAGQRGRLIIPRSSLSLDGDFSWISSEEATLTLSGQALYVPELESDDDYSGFARVTLFDDAVAP